MKKTWILSLILSVSPILFAQQTPQKFLLNTTTDGTTFTPMTSSASEAPTTKTPTSYVAYCISTSTPTPPYTYVPCIFSGGGGGSGTVTDFLAPTASWPSWLVPAVTNGTTVPSLAVSASAIPYSALTSLSANHILGSLTATTPSGLALPSCSGASNALIWTSGTGFGCNTISGGGGTTIVNTTFNESSAGTPLAGTTPATCVSTCVPPWTLASGADGTYQSGGGVLFNTVNSEYDVIDSGQTDYTLTFNANVGGSSLGQVAARYVDGTHQVVISMCNSSDNCGGTITTGFAIFDGPSFTLLGGISGAVSGNYIVVLSGTQITVTGPAGTIGPFTTGNTTGTKVGLRLGVGNSVEFTSLSVTSGAGSSGFPITLGSTSIAASSTTTSIAGLTVNGVTLNATGSSSLFLNQAGGYTAPSGSSSFSSLTSGTNSTAAMIVGTGASLATSGSGTIAATTAATLATSRTIAGTSFNGSANIALANKFIVQGTTDAGLSGAQFLGALGTGLVKNTTTTSVLTIAASSDVTALWTGTCSSSTFLRGDGACATPSGSGTVTTSGTPTTGFVSLFTGSTVIGNSHIDDGITAASTVTVSEALAATGGLTGGTTGGAGGNLTLPEGTAATASSGNDVCYGDSTAHAVKCSYNNGSFFSATQTIASGQIAIPVTALAGNTCDASATTATATGALATDSPTVSYASDPTGVTGYGGGTNGGISISVWTVANTFEFKRCNETSSSITPGALNLNWRVTR